MLLKSAGVFVGHMETGRRARSERTPCPRTARLVAARNRSFNAALDFVSGREPDMSRKLLLTSRGRIDYSLRALGDAGLEREVAHVSCVGYAHLVNTMRSCTAEALAAHARPGPLDCARASEVVPLAHGWKHSASMFLLPVYAHMFGRRGFSFVHVVRDGRDMALSTNRASSKRYPHLCGLDSRPERIGACARARPTRSAPASGSTGAPAAAAFAQAGSTADGGTPSTGLTSPRGNPKGQLQVWALANLGVTRLGRRLLGERYLVVRAEDVVTADQPTRARTVRRMLAQLGLRSRAPEAQLLEVFDRPLGDVRAGAGAIGLGNASRAYSGKWRRALSPACIAQLLALPLVCEALHEYGYLQLAACREAGGG
jgi:hypothetical protein